LDLSLKKGVWLKKRAKRVGRKELRGLVKKGLRGFSSYGKGKKEMEKSV
jgi:hypothetical protein